MPWPRLETFVAFTCADTMNGAARRLREAPM
jgi:hypothetical protein